MTDTDMIMTCRTGCGACCIAPSISSRVPGMANGKPADVRCLHLTAENTCELYGSDDRPAICSSYKATELCGLSREDALRNIRELEAATK